MAKLRDELTDIVKRDPAARNRLEVALTYPGFHAILLHRGAHWLWQHEVKLLARIVSAISRLLTGIEIHPAAIIGDYCFIDHGHGVVIGETSVIGNRVTLYHDVTLGGTALVEGKRHPTLEDDVVVGAGAQVLGPITIGKGAHIGANAVVVKPVRAGATMVGIPAREVAEDAHAASMAYGTPRDGTDPLQAELEQMRLHIERLEQRLKPKEESGSGI